MYNNQSVSTARIVVSLWLFGGAACVLVYEMGIRGFPNYMDIIFILLLFIAVGTFGAIRG